MFAARDLRPMLATLPDRPPSLTDPALVYEPKYDGIRAIVEIVPASPKRGTSEGGPAAVRVWSRLGNEKSAQFPDIIEAAGEWGRALEGPVVLDAEIVALDEQGRPAGFQRLQHRIHVSVPGYRSRKPILAPEAQPAAIIVFDVLRNGDLDLRSRPLTERREHLEALFTAHPSASPLLRLAEQRAGDGRPLLARADHEGWEGLLVKRARSRYQAGRRSPDWLKYKLHRQDEFVVGGWTAPKGTRSHFGALMLGVPSGPRDLPPPPRLPPPPFRLRRTRGRASKASGPRRAVSLRYVGDVGTGFTERELDKLWQLLRRLETPACPFGTPPKTLDAAHWVRPELVAQVRYAEMTDEGRLRHPVYLGLRDDVTAPKVLKAPGVPVLPPASPKPAPLGRAGEGGKPAPRTQASEGGPEVRLESGISHDAQQALIEQLNDLEKRRKNGRLHLPDGDWLEVTNLHKVFWPHGRRTKGELLRHYVRVAPFILPVLANRPLVMKRFPNGIEDEAFYQHRAPEPVPKHVRIETLPDDEVPARLVGGSLKTLLYMAQLAAISMDPWFSTVDSPREPDQAAIDLDPQPGATFDRIVDVARWVHDELERLAVPAFPKTSGAEGLHIYIPLPAGAPYEAGMIFCQIVATMVAARHPDIATVERNVSKRRDKTVYVDYLQNIHGKTLASAYSARAIAFAGVSAPLTWKEVHRGGFRPRDFSIDTIEERIGAVGDLWAGLRGEGRADLLGALEKLRA
jgi:bifunctional non-homologous end joining protein LigD